jgi:cell division protein FtsQ
MRKKKQRAHANRRRLERRPWLISGMDKVRNGWRWSLARIRGRSAEPTARKWHTLRRAGRFAAGVTVIAFLGAGVFMADRYARTAPAFATADIQINGLQFLTREQILQQAEIRVGKNIFAVSALDAEAKLREHPWIASAKVERRLPGRYTIELSERRAVALLIMGEAFLVASDGTVFKKLEDGEPYDLPLITGLDQEPFAADRALRASALLNAVALLSEYTEVGLTRFESINEIHLGIDQDLSLTVGEDAVSVRLGNRPYRPKLGKLRQVLETLRQKNARAAYVYLDNAQHASRVTVRPR